MVLLAQELRDGNELNLCLIESLVFRLAEIQNILDQFVQFCYIISQYGTVFLQLLMLLLAGVTMNVFVCTIDQREWRTKLMGDVREEVQFGFV